MEDSEGNIKNLKEDFWFWEVAHMNVKTPQSQIACFFRMFAEMVETSHDVIYYDLLWNSEKRRFNKISITLSEYKLFPPELENGIQKVKWLVNQCFRCLELTKKYKEEEYVPEIPISVILERYREALKEARKLYKEEFDEVM